MNIRDFTGGDFASASRLVGSVRHAEHGSRSYWYGSYELCGCLAQSDHGIVVELDAETLGGIVLLASAHEHDRNAEMRQHWLQQRALIATMCRSLGMSFASAASLEEAYDEQASELWGAAAAEHVTMLVLAEDLPPRAIEDLASRASSWLREHGVADGSLAGPEQLPIVASDERAEAAVGELLNAHARTKGVDFVTYNYQIERDGELVAGITAWAMGSDVHIDMLAVAESERGHGLGSRLLAHVEQQASRDGCTTASVDTFSFQAPEFYPAQGYEVVFRYPLDDGTERIYFSKRLG